METPQKFATYLLHGSSSLYESTYDKHLSEDKILMFQAWYRVCSSSSTWSKTLVLGLGILGQQNNLGVLDTTLPPADPEGNEEGQAHSAGVKQHSLHADLNLSTYNPCDFQDIIILPLSHRNTATTSLDVNSSFTIPSLDEIGGGINVNTFTFTVPGTYWQNIQAVERHTMATYNQKLCTCGVPDQFSGRSHSRIGNFSIMSTWQGVITHALATSPSCQHGGMCLAEHVFCRVWKILYVLFINLPYYAKRYDNALQLVALKRIPAVDTSTGDGAATAVVEKKELDEAVVASNSCCRRGRVRSAAAVINLSTHPNILLQ
ncbi:uncharacterized protein HD556DRAFT_1309406 [Suillus plorans]|uniref:Uncharacterized protein n=1 Tax=Suillus plorans TaxID=116603 RepID=A0A9P7AML6_9AGAM|nr:uncharacterized protein HD556DRAFT_1309406 [Suillus plorans]KAG1792339.1 hypothetical protein HD556DRAFT_1309406 [Suillus plorans]